MTKQFGQLRPEGDALVLRTWLGQWVGPLHDAGIPYTSASWDGDSYSTTAKTLLDLSAVFGIPANVRQVRVKTAVRDSGSAASQCVLLLGWDNTAGLGMVTPCSGLTNDAWSYRFDDVWCDANGDVYYQIIASGASTMDIYIEIYGYML